MPSEERGNSNVPTKNDERSGLLRMLRSQKQTVVLFTDSTESLACAEVCRRGQPLSWSPSSPGAWMYRPHKSVSRGGPLRINPIQTRGLNCMKNSMLGGEWPNKPDTE